MIAGASSTPGLGAEVAARIAPVARLRRRRGRRGPRRLAAGRLVPEQDAGPRRGRALPGAGDAGHLDGDPAPALALFDRRPAARRAARRPVRDRPAPPRRRRDLRPAAPTRGPRDDRSDTGFDVVTGAFSYSGGAIAAGSGRRRRKVRTLTGHPGRGAGGRPIEVRPLDFDDPLGLVASLRGRDHAVQHLLGPVPPRTDDHDGPWPTRAPCSMPPAGPGSSGSSTCHHPPEHRRRRTRTSGARREVERALAESACPTPSSVRPSSSAATAC